MTTPIVPPLTGEIWHLSIEDLFASVPQQMRLGGPGPFVINLTASSAPIGLPTSKLAEAPRAVVYQIQRVEDRRLRYRLRLGPFANEDQADLILQKVRDIYPGALTATADAEDLRAISSMEAKIETPKLSVAEPVHRPVELKAAAYTPVSTPVSTPTPMPMPMPMPVPVLVPEAIDPPAAVPPVLPASTQVFFVRTPAQPLRQARPPASALPVSTPAPTVAAGNATAATLQAEAAASRGLTLETTHTVRALTSHELQNKGLLPWFIIQLSLSEEPFDPEALPDLDIFSVYRLYSVAGIDQGRILHALRLGFFGEEIAAAAVASYLTAYYDKPTIKRVSVAERERFANERLAPRKDVGATGQHAVIEITGERFIREKRLTDPGTAARIATLSQLTGRTFGK